MEEFIRWSLEYDMWCKMQFFGKAIGNADRGDEEVFRQRGPQNLLEITANLPLMLEAMQSFPNYQPVIAGAPGIDEEFYAPYINKGAKIIFGKTYDLLNNAHAALVTSGTATLETALFNVPQIVCYATPMAKIYSWLKRHFLKVKYVSLVNLITDRESVKELIAADMTVEKIKDELREILPADSKRRAAILEEYNRMKDILGKPGASERAAEKIVFLLKNPQ